MHLHRNSGLSEFPKGGLKNGTRSKENIIISGMSSSPSFLYSLWESSLLIFQQDTQDLEGEGRRATPRREEFYSLLSLR